MKVTWDATKGRTNLAKHGVSFELAAQVFDDPLYLAIFDRVTDYEERWHAIGTARNAVILLVVHSFRDCDGQECTRIISARKATPHERRQYEQGKYTQY